MRVRIPELLTERRITPYAVARGSDGRISLSSIYRLTERRGRLDTFSADLIEGLCDVLHVSPGDLFEREHAPAGQQPVRDGAKHADGPSTVTAKRSAEADG